jgi:DNA-binding transcriptional ArsR family regulator
MICPARVTAKPRYQKHGGRAALEAIASPARQELLLALGDDRASVRELAARLGRSRSALHYHVTVLERAGFIEGVEVRGTGRERETVYARTANALSVNARPTRSEIDISRRAGDAMLRLTQRELSRALEDGLAPGADKNTRVFGARGKARLTAAQLARAGALIDELLALFADSPAPAPASRGSRSKLYAITVVLAPTRDANAPATPRRRKKVRR